MSDDKLTDGTGRNSLDPKHAPVPVPAGSFDVVALTKGLDKAAGVVTAAKRAEKIETAFKDAASDKTSLTQRNPASMPGYTFKTVENQLGGKEVIHVFDPKAAAAVEKEEAAREEEAEQQREQAVAAAEIAASGEATAPVPSATSASGAAKSE